MKSNLKFLSGLVTGILVTSSISYLGLTQAQATASPSGKYGCLVNKNFAGYNASLDGSNSVGYHYMLQFDLAAKTSQIINVHLIDNFGRSNISTKWAAGAAFQPVAGTGSGTLEIKESPDFPGAYLIRSTSTGENNSKFTTTYAALLVNSGNTMLVSSGTGGNADSTPFTGVCNKI